MVAMALPLKLEIYTNVIPITLGSVHNLANFHSGKKLLKYLEVLKDFWTGTDEATTIHFGTIILICPFLLHLHELYLFFSSSWMA